MPELAPILIVDDEKNTREGLRLALEADFEVFTAADIAGALRVLDSTPIEVLVTDLRLGGESGMDLVERARKRPQPPMVIMMTAYGDVSTAVEAMRRGAWHFVTKPLDLEELDQLVRRAGVQRRRQLRAEAQDASAAPANRVPAGTETRTAPAATPAAPSPTPRPVRSPAPRKPRPATSANASPAAPPTPENPAGLSKIIGDSPPVEELRDLIRQVAPTRASVLIQGESGTGKELVARALHDLSPRAGGPFVAVHCAALSEQLLESELFGHEKGSFTGATQERMGRFELAHGGTLFLDEIGEISPATQVKLLRALGERSIERVGGSRPIAVDVRLVSATNRDLWKMTLDGQFRDDLYYRLAVVRIEPPPLRQRGADILLLAQRFLQEFCAENGLPPKSFSPELRQRLLEHRWPGNVRELRTVVEHAVVMSRAERIEVSALPSSMAIHAADPSPALAPPRLQDGPAISSADHSGTAPAPGQTAPAPVGRFNLQDQEQRLIDEALAATGGNRTQAAKLLGISRRTLQRKLGDDGEG